MFTGIIQEVGTIARLERSAGLVRLTVYAPKVASQVARLDSVAIDGVCLSVVAVRHGAMIFEMIRETQKLTTLRRLRRGERVNLEPSLSMSDRLNGHILFGHVDGVGTIVKRRQLPSELVLKIRTAPRLRRLLVPKGPVAVDGISLTVGGTLGASSFTVHLIPETLHHTTLASRRMGDLVNVELDYFAKLIVQFLHSTSPPRLHK